jgi:hypothetical protein
MNWQIFDVKTARGTYVGCQILLEGLPSNAKITWEYVSAEKLYLNQCNSESEIHQAVEEYIYFYNYQRFQAKLKQRAPIEYRHALAA